MHLPDARIDHTKTKVGYEIPINRHFYCHEPPRPLEVIEAEIKGKDGKDKNDTNDLPAFDARYPCVASVPPRR
jgi:hypothetical protein